MDDLALIELALSRRWFLPSLPSRLEASYDAATRAGRRHSLKLYLGCILLVMLACSPFDVYADVARLGFSLRFGVLAPLILSCIWLLGRDRSVALEGGLGIGCVMAVVGSVTMLGLRAHSPYTEGYLMGAGMIGFAVNLSMPLRPAHALALYVGNVSVYCGLALSEGADRHFAQTPQLAIFFGITMLATLRFAISREHGSRNVYLFQLREALHARELATLVEELTRVADRDALTGIGNRRLFDKLVGQCWVDARVEGGSLALAMIDVDHFKSLNDRAGHAEGDRCLRAVARAIAAASQSDGGLPARYGGEEFAVLIPIPRRRQVETSDLDAMGERLRGAVEALALPHPASTSGGPVTVSVGVALATPGCDGSEPGNLLAAADRALYAAKRAGRNRVELARIPGASLDAAA